MESIKFALNVLTRLKALLNVVKIDERTVELALSSGFKDFEDAIQNYAAVDADVNCIITRNKVDYKESNLVICTAKEYLAIRESQV